LGKQKTDELAMTQPKKKKTTKWFFQNHAVPFLKTAQ
jgi:hypothetical protein